MDSDTSSFWLLVAMSIWIQGNVESLSFHFLGVYP